MSLIEELYFFELNFSFQFSFNESNVELEEKNFLSYFSFFTGSFRVSQAWETLNDPVKKEKYDRKFFSSSSTFDSLNENWKEKFNSKKYSSSIKDKEVEAWIKEIYTPINRLISQIIKPLNNEIKKLSADPYDDLSLIHI